MNIRRLAVWLPCMLILAMLASLVTPSPVLAAGEPPPPAGEKSPKSPAAPGKPAPPAAAAGSSYTAEIPVTAPDGAANAAAIALSVDAIAQAGAVLVGPSGNPLPLAAQETAGVLAVGDVYFKGSGSGCGGGWCNYDTIANALTNFSAHNGTGMIYATGASAETGAVNVDGTFYSLGKLTGLAWDGSTVKAARILSGLLTVQNMLKGFTVDGFYIGKGIYAHDNAGTLRLQNLYVTNNSGAGIFVNNHKGNIDLFNVTVSGAMGAVDHQTGGDGTYLDNCIWNDTTHKCTGTGSVTIGNSSFNVNRDHGLVVITSGSALLERVEAIGNWVSRSGEGVYLKVGKGVTVKDSRFNGNGYSDQAGLKIEGAGAINLQNVEARYNEGYGMIINVANDITINGGFFVSNGGFGLDAYSSGGNITLNNLQSQSNPMGVKVDNSTSASAKTVTITNSLFNGSSAGDGLLVRSKGSVTLNHIHAENNSGMGVSIDNRLDYNPVTNAYPGSGSVSLLNTNGLNQLISNSGAALSIKSKGAITLKGVYADGNHAGLLLDGCGIDANPVHTTHYCLDKSNVTLSAVQVENTSTGAGLVVLAGGAISLDGGSFISNQRQVSLVNYIAAAGKPVTVTNSSFEKTVAAASVGLEVYSKGSITLNNVQAVSNQGKLLYGPLLEPVSGILLDNCMLVGSACSGSGKVSVLSSLGPSKAVGNVLGEGLSIFSQGAVTVSGFSSTNNGGGAYLENNHGALTVANSTFSYNTGVPGGLIARSSSAVTLSGVQASENSAGPGASVQNIFGPTTTDIITISKSHFDHNGKSGLLANAKGNLTLNNVSANAAQMQWNGGANISSNNGSITILDTLGPNQFCSNDVFGLWATTGKGAISISGVTALNNTGDGISLHNSGSVVTAQKILAEGNWRNGLEVQSKGSVTLNGIQANDNKSYYGVYIDNCQGDTTCAGSGSVSLLSTLGPNSLSRNLYGLWIKSGGNVLVNGTTASNNSYDFDGYGVIGLSGAWIENYFTPGKTVTVNQSNFNSNHATGLYIHSAGVITLNAIGASYNATGTNQNSDETGDGGIYIRNDEAGVTAGINILSTSGNNQFNGNTRKGLWVVSNGSITLNKVIASDNGLSGHYSGVLLHTNGAASSVSITCSAFNHNGQWGLEVAMGGGVLTFKSVAANNNQAGGSIEMSLGGKAPVVSWTVCGK